jgi:ligand-binding sensor domain-containing protein
MFRRLRSREAGWQWTAAGLLTGVLMAATVPAGGAPEPGLLTARPVVGRNADGYLEVFQVDAQGEVRHRWQKPSNGDWSGWASLAGTFEPGLALTPDAGGRLTLFAVDKQRHQLWLARQALTNSTDWSAWVNLGGAVESPVAAARNSDGRLEVFALAAGRPQVLHRRETAPGGPWSPWSRLEAGDGPTLDPGLAVTRNADGRLELFGVAANHDSLLHCWQHQPGSSADWSHWRDLGGSIFPGFVVGRNAVGVLEVFAIERSTHRAQRIRQSAPGNSSQWTGWEDFGGDFEPGLALGQSADQRLELIAVGRTTLELMHRWENLVTGADQWSSWAGMGQRAQAAAAVGQNEDGNLEVFALDPDEPGRINHRRQISRASDWLDWSSLDQRTFRYTTRTWQTDEGLPANSVQAIAQTQDGYLWVGTSAGLARFDGLAFTAANAPCAPELDHCSITALAAAADRSLWVGTDGCGLVRLQDSQCTRFNTTNGLAGERVNAIYQDRQGALWVGTTTGMSRYRNGRFTSFTTRQGLSSDNVRAICEDRTGELWLATGAGLNRLAGRKMVSFPMPNGLPNDSVRAICQDRGGRIWIGSNNGMLWYSSYWTNFYAYNTRYGLSDTFVSAICEDREGNLWVGTYSGLNRFREGRFFPELNNEGVPFDRVNALFEDREGDLWVGSREGLTRLTPKRFVTYTRRQGLTHNNVTSVLEDNSGSIWLGTWGGGLDRLKDERVTAFAATNVFAQGLVLSLCEARDGSLWFGADFDGALTRLKEGRFTHYTWHDGLLNAPVRALHEDRAGTLWIGTGEGLCALKNRKFEPYSGPDQAGHAAVRSICEDRQGTLWFGTEAGLVRLQKGHFRRFTTQDGLSDDSVLALCTDPEGVLWIGTAGHGLVRWRDGHFGSCGKKQGLFSDEIFSILEDDHGWLWMSCSRGVFRVRKADLNEVCDGKRQRVTSLEYGRNDGLETIQCSGVAQPAGWKSRDGRLWFATSKGLAMVDPNTIRINSWAPPVVIEHVLADKRPILFAGSDRSASRRDAGAALVIPPGRGELEFRYAALSLQAPETCRFRYQLEGVDSEWVEAGTRRSAHYNNIYPGQYTFRVVACNKDGTWNEQGAALALVVRPHLWQTWWWRGLVAVLLVGSVGGTARYVSQKRLRRQLELLEQRHALEKERGRIAKDIHDDLGSSLTRIMMLGERAEEGLARKEEVAPHIGKIIDSARHTVQALDEIVWAVNPENDTLEGLVEYLSHYANEFFENSNVRCRLEIPVQLPARALPAEVRHDLFLVVKEAFHNVLKHAQASEVRVELSLGPASVQIELQDNGRGFDPEHLAPGRKGNGLGNMEKRVKGLGGTRGTGNGPWQRHTAAADCSPAPRAGMIWPPKSSGKLPHAKGRIFIRLALRRERA